MTSLRRPLTGRDAAGAGALLAGFLTVLEVGVAVVTNRFRLL
jgi:hypothetical protein